MIRYTNIISRSIAELDDMISTCMQFDADLLETLNNQFKEDKYVDWAKEQSGLKDHVSNEPPEFTADGDVEKLLQYKLF